MYQFETESFIFYFSSKSNFHKFVSKIQYLRNIKHCMIYYTFPIYANIEKDSGKIFYKDFLDFIYKPNQVFGYKIGAFLPSEVFFREEAKYKGELRED